MASKRSRNAGQKEFKNFIFSDAHLTPTACAPLFKELERDPNQVSQLLSNRTILVMFLSNFEKYAERISQFFRQVDGGLASPQAAVRLYVGPGLPDVLIGVFLARLLSDEFRQFQTKPAFHNLLCSIVNFCLTLRSAQLGVLAKALCEKDQLLELLISGENSGQIMRKWIHAFDTGSTLFESNVFTEWTKRLIVLCRRCEGNHLVSRQFRIWKDLQGLISRLTLALDTLASMPKNAPKLVPLENLRKLADRDNRPDTSSSRWTQNPPDNSVVVTPQDSSLLGNFGIAPPASEHALQDAIKKLQRDQTVKVLKALADSFPCSPCHQASIGGPLGDDTAEIELPVEQEEHIRSRRLFTELFGANLGIWRVCLSAQALKDLEQSQSEGNSDHIQSKLKQLASGDWSRKSLTEPAGDPVERKECHGILAKASYGSNGRILWQVDVEFDEQSGVVKQLVKVWKIGDVKEISSYIPNVLRVLKTYSANRTKACKKVVLDRENVCYIPATFDESALVRTGGTVELPTDIPDAKVLEPLLESNKFYMVTQTTIDNLVSQNLGAEFPLVLCAEELRIVKNYRTSTLILGRSGTGKTTCLVYKLVGKYLASHSLQLGRRRRQVLLTRSSVLANKLGYYTKALLATQLKEFTSVADGEVSETQLLAEDDREVKQTISSLKDGDFPLVCTFDRFMKILENTVKSANRKDFSLSRQQYPSLRYTSKEVGVRSRLFRPPQVVDFEVFTRDYWPSLPRTKGIPAALAFMEIIGVIKGSATRRHSSSPYFRPLSREEYQEGRHKISTVTTDRRWLYDLYERYEQLKRGLGDVDDVDRAISVLEAISEDVHLRGRIEKSFDEVYVDEIQDQRLLEIEMLLQIVRTPVAVHFAGDTAQCISKDSAFRFQNVKSLMFEHFSHLSQVAKSPELARPQLCALYKNYRTHQGILSLASYIMRVLLQCFPRTVDQLPDEFGQFSGPKPIVFVGLNEDVLSVRMVAMSDLDAQDTIRFGAEQVIIVRDTADKDRLKDAIGESALVLTIMESKGMEFEDVLLYDFFSTSACIPAFRALVDSKELDESHIVLCSELKQLYVAITRSQNRLWLFESSGLKISPVIKLLTTQKEPLVEVAYANDIDIKEKLAQLRSGSTARPATWSKKGHEFLRKKDYENARFCFERAGDNHGGTLTAAYLAEKRGYSNITYNQYAAEQAFLEAVKLFKECGLPIRQASCYEMLGEFETAADIFASDGEYGRAAELFDRAGSLRKGEGSPSKAAGCFNKASDAYSLDGRYSEGASILSREGLFQELVGYLKRYGYLLDSTERLHYSRLCYLLLDEEMISPNLRKDIVDALGTSKEKEEFYIQYEMTDKLLTLYIDDLDDYEKALALLEEKGDPDNAWEVIAEHIRGSFPRRQPLEYEAKVYQYARSRDFLASLGTVPGDISLPTISGLGAPDPWPYCGLVEEFWDDLEPTIHKLFTHQIPYRSIDFPEKWMKQFFDITVTFKLEAFTKTAKTISHLPIESLVEVVEILSRTDFGESIGIPEALFLFLRVCPIPPRGSYAILKSSPLLVGSDSSPQIWDSSRTLQEITQWTLRQVFQSVFQIQQRADELYKEIYPPRCSRFLASGSCYKFQTATCAFPHNQITLQEYAMMVEDLLRMNSLYCALLEIFYRYRRPVSDAADPESFFGDFRPRSRRWSERLLGATTYVSPLENAPTIIVHSRNDISREEGLYYQVSRGLRNLSFRRLNENWYDIRDFSSILEQLQVAEILGIERHFWRIVNSKAQIQWDPHARRNIWVIRETERALNGQDIDESSVKLFDNLLQTIEPSEMCAFHAVSLVYEKAATFLIRMCHKSGFLLPNGWVEMHLLSDSRLAARNAHQFTETLMQGRRMALMSLIRSFCRLMRKIENSPDYEHKLSGRPSRWRRLVRRNVDFLLTCLLNASSWQREFPFDYAITMGEVKKALQTEFASFPDIVHCPNENSIARRFARSFDNCAGKDSLLIVKERGEKTSYFSFLSTTIPTTFLETLKASSIAPTKLSPAEFREPTDGNLGDQEEKAAKIIQTMWKIRYPILQKRREFLKTPKGRAVAYIGSLCRVIAEPAALSPREVVARRAILFDRGLYLYEYCHEIEEKYSEVKRKVTPRRKEAAKSKSMRQMEEFRLQWERLSAMKELIQERAGILAEKNWQNLHVSSSVLGEKINITLKALRSIDADLEMIME